MERKNNYYDSQWCPRTGWCPTFVKISSFAFNRYVWNYSHYRYICITSLALITLSDSLLIWCFWEPTQWNLICFPALFLIERAVFNEHPQFCRCCLKNSPLSFSPMEPSGSGKQKAHQAFMICLIKFVAVDGSQVAYFSRCLRTTSIKKPDDKSTCALRLCYRGKDGALRRGKSRQSQEWINQGAPHRAWMDKGAIVLFCRLWCVFQKSQDDFKAEVLLVTPEIFA